MWASDRLSEREREREGETECHTHRVLASKWFTHGSKVEPTLC